MTTDNKRTLIAKLAKQMDAEPCLGKRAKLQTTWQILVKSLPRYLKSDNNIDPRTFMYCNTPLLYVNADYLIGENLTEVFKTCKS